MAAEFSQDAVLHFLQSSGGTVRNSDLLQHFSSFLRDHAERQSHRERFKKFVNSVATVKQTDGVSYVVLRKKFRGYVAGAGTDTFTQNVAPERPAGADSRWYKVQQRDEVGPAPPGQTLTKTILPAAGILEVSAEQQVKSLATRNGRPAAAQGGGPSPELKISGQAAPAALQQGTKAGQQGRVGDLQNGSTPVLPATGQQREPSRQVQEPLEEDLQGPHPQNLHDHSPHIPSHVSPRRHRYRQSYKTAVSYDEDDEELEIVTSRQYLEAQPRNSITDTSGAISVSSSRISEPPAQASDLAFSSSERTIPKIYIQDIERETLNLEGPGWGSEPQVGQRGHRDAPTSVPARLEAGRHSLPPSPHGSAAPLSDGSHKPTGVRPEPENESHQSPKSWLASSHSTMLSSSSDLGFSGSEGLLQGSPRASGRRSSMEDVQEAKAGESVFLADSVEALQQMEDTHGAGSDGAAPWHRSASNLDVRQQPAACSTENLHGKRDFRARVMPWHLSTGDLYDDYHDTESSEGSTCSPQPQQRSLVTRQFSRHLRNRMCRSLGADLDQLLHDEPTGDAEEGGTGGAAGGGGGGGGSEAARRSRLHRISSSLSLRYNLSSSSLSSCSTPPRCQSLGDLVEKEGKGSLAAATSCNSEYEGRSRQSLIPLEPREHAWLVKGAAGAWPDIYSLFREDSSLLNRQDFMSGFTVLHWIAKHGDHRVLNTLWYGVEKAGMTFDVDARSNSGQTPLHVAAIHSNKNILRLLVTKFKANVRVRDMAGKRPWHYLSRTAPLDMFQLLGGPARAVVAADGAGRLESSWEVQQRRRRRHHLSMASSAERPLKLAGGTKVKRSSSIAAFLKHKSLHRFYGHQSDSVL